MTTEINTFEEEFTPEKTGLDSSRAARALLLTVLCVVLFPSRTIAISAISNWLTPIFSARAGFMSASITTKRRSMSPSSEARGLKLPSVRQSWRKS